MNKQLRKLAKFSPVLSMFVPLTVFAQTNASNASEVLTRVSDFLGALLPVLVGAGVVYFIYGVVTYFIGDDETAKKAGKDRIIYGIIGLAVIVSIWGLVAILRQTLGVGDGVSAPTADIANLAVTTGGACTPITPTTTFQGVITYITCVIGQSVIPLIFAIAMVTFIWGAVKFFILESDEAAKREQGKQYMLWGIVALAVMISVWGLVGILRSTFGVTNSVLPGVRP